MISNMHGESGDSSRGEYCDSGFLFLKGDSASRCASAPTDVLYGPPNLTGCFGNWSRATRLVAQAVHFIKLSFTRSLHFPRESLRSV